MKPAKLQPAVFGGLFIGIVSAVPVIGLANMCCLWVFVGGVITARVMQQHHPTPITLVDGALAGALAGAMGLTIHGIIAVAVQLVLHGATQGLIGALLRSQDLPASIGDARPAVIAAIVTALLLLALAVEMAVAALGGLVGALFFKKAAPPRPLPGSPAPAATMASSTPPRESWPPVAHRDDAP